MDIPLIESAITTDERKILEEIGLKISAGNLLSENLDAIFPDIQKIVPCDRIAIGLVEENGQRIEICHGVAPHQPQLVDFIDDVIEPATELIAPQIEERGVGLYVSWKIIHLHGGRIFAESDNRTWAQFTFELP